MILSKVYEDAENRLERNKITLGEFERLVDIEVIEPKRGEWEERPSEDWISIRRWYCSECGERQTYGMTNYCPNCGADMRGDNDGKDIQSADE